ncbi:MAG: DUF63 family protein [Candidatus Micrarchaeia archaeon]
MTLDNIISQYFVAPIMDKTGYNLVNTLTYALIAIVALYFIWRYFEKKKIDIDASFFAGAIAFTIFGACARVIVDSVDSGVMAQAAQTFGAGTVANEIAGGAYLFGFNGAISNGYFTILSSHVFDYGFLTVSPGIYIVVATLFLICILIEKKLGIKYWAAIVGGALAILNLIILAPMMAHLIYGLIVVVLALAATLIAKYVAKLDKPELLLGVFGQGLDGAATWVAIDWFGKAQGIIYSEQHPISRAIGMSTPLGFGMFFLLKIVFVIVAIKLISSEKDSRMKMIALLAIAIMGLAPGIRDMLRMMAGT